MKNLVSLQDLLKIIIMQVRQRKRLVIAISGFGGSGKSTAAQKLAEQLNNTTIIHLDDFILNRLSERSSDWAGFDWKRLVTQVLQPIKDGASEIEYDVYDWGKNNFIEKRRVSLASYIIVEGIGLIRPSLKKYFAFSVWMNIPLETASERGKKRDREEYQVDYDKLWDTLWTPNDKDYFDTYRPDGAADYLLDIDFKNKL